MQRNMAFLMVDGALRKVGVAPGHLLLMFQKSIPLKLPSLEPPEHTLAGTPGLGTPSCPPRWCSQDDSSARYPSCVTRLPSAGALTRSGRSCRAVFLKEMKTLRAHGFSQRPRFERWWATWSGMSRCPWTSRTARPPRSSRATSTWTILYSPARTPLVSAELPGKSAA